MRDQALMTEVEPEMPDWIEQNWNPFFLHTTQDLDPWSQQTLKNKNATVEYSINSVSYDTRYGSYGTWYIDTKMLKTDAKQFPRTDTEPK